GQHARSRKPADQEILRPCFLGAAFIAGECARDVERDRQQLEAEKDRDQRGGRREHHHADDRGEHQDVELGLAHAGLLQVRVRDGDCQDAEAGEEDIEEQREAVAGRHPVVRGAACGVDPAIYGGAQRVGEPRDRDHRHHAAPAFDRDDQVGDDRKEHETRQRDDGSDLTQVGERLRPAVRGQRGNQRHLYSPTWPTEVISCVSAYGYRPMANIRRTSGVISASWPAWMSPEDRGPAGSPYMAPWNMRSMYTGASTSPIAPTAASTGARSHAPKRVMNSPTKLFKPGRPNAARTTIMKTPAMIGILGASPASAERSRVPARSAIHATKRKSAGMMIPWLTICRIAPCWPWMLYAKMPRTMKPMWLTLE